MKRWLVLFLCFTLTGCTKHIKWTYPPVNEPPVAVKSKSPLVVAVLPFEDERGYVRKNYAPLIIVPCVPFIPIHYDRPEDMMGYLTITTYTADPCLDLAQAAAYELKRSGLFKEVFFTEEVKGIGRADLILAGKIKSTYFRGSTYPYCLSILGAVFWYVGAPAGSMKNVLGVDISLSARQADQKAWNYSIQKERFQFGGLYYNWGEDVDGFPWLMQEGMREAIKDLDSKIENNEVF
jgi:hypothetical protein